MKKFLLVLLFLAGCATAQPPAVNVRDGRGYCPICHESHPDAQMRWPVEHEGRCYRFCDPNCQAAFVKNPGKFLKDPRFNPPAGDAGSK